MKGLYLTGDYEPRPGYILTGRELDGDGRALNGNAIWKNSKLPDSFYLLGACNLTVFDPVPVVLPWVLPEGFLNSVKSSFNC